MEVLRIHCCPLQSKEIDHCFGKRSFSYLQFLSKNESRSEGNRNAFFLNMPLALPKNMPLHLPKEIPLDLPQVPFQHAGDEGPSWVDLDYIVNRQRLLFLSGRVVDKNGNDLLALMLFLVGEEPDEDLFLFLNCARGSIHAGIALYDMIQVVLPSVYTIGLGLAASTGSYILSGGNKRQAFLHAKIRLYPVHKSMKKIHKKIHKPKDKPIRIWPYTPKPKPKPKRKSPIPIKRKGKRLWQILQKIRILKALRDKIIQDYAEQTGGSESIIEMDMERHVSMTAMEAKDYGILDNIIESISLKGGGHLYVFS